MTSPHSRSAHELLRDLLGREALGDSPDAVAVASARVCERVLGNLSRWVGVDGAAALVSRALLRAQANHPALANVRYSREAAVCLEGLVESARIHGEGAVADGVAGVLTALTELLGRLIGDDLALRLIEHAGPAESPAEARPSAEEDTP